MQSSGYESPSLYIKRTCSLFVLTRLAVGLGKESSLPPEGGYTPKLVLPLPYTALSIMNTYSLVFSLYSHKAKKSIRQKQILPY